MLVPLEAPLPSRRNTSCGVQSTWEPPCGVSLGSGPVTPLDGARRTDTDPAGRQPRSIFLMQTHHFVNGRLLKALHLPGDKDRSGKLLFPGNSGSF